MTVRHRGRIWGDGPKIVALGGGHGLSATLAALRGMSDNLTAIVGVSDDGGSSGRLRNEFDIVPPGDMRMALAALCGDDSWGRTWSQVLQHRFPGDGELAGHAVGNLLIAALWQETDDLVAGSRLRGRSARSERKGAALGHLSAVPGGRCRPAGWDRSDDPGARPDSGGGR